MRKQTRKPSLEIQSTYTRSLLKSIPANQVKGERLYTIPGLPPDTSQIIRGCAFTERNQIGDQNECLTNSRPEFKEIEPGHWVQNCPGCLS